MAKITSKNIELKDDEKVIFGTDDDAYVEWDQNANQLVISTVVSGVTPTQSSHLTTKYYVDTAMSGVQTIFGSNYFVAEDATQTDTTSTSYALKLRLTASGMQAGNYRIDYYSEWLHSKTATTFGYKVEVDDTTIIHETAFSPANASSWYSISGFDYYTLTSGTHTFDIEFLSSSTTSTSSIKNARIEVWRIS
jgi:hypothetical protein